MEDELLEIPLFPLGLVLFPGMVQPLHIFEPRYRQMTTFCLDTNIAFGVALALPESEHEREVPARVGTLARIADYHRLPDGRYNLLAVGAERFEIVEVRRDKPYLTALVRLLHDEDEGTDLKPEAEGARAALDEYLRLMLALIGSEDKEISIPEDATELSFLISVCLTCDDADKQRLLELRSTAERLREETGLLSDEAEELARQSRAVGVETLDTDRSSLN